MNVTTACFQPLNPQLYHALKARFGSVLIANEGVGMQMVNWPDPLNVGRYKSTIIDAGEYYRVCCPYCGDARHRLWINHQWAQLGPNGFPQLWLAHCFNKDCIDNVDRRRDLEDKVFGFRNANVRKRPFEIAPGQRTSDALAPVTLPGHVLSVDTLPTNHPAAVYLRDERRHDLQILGQQFRVSYCHDADREYRGAQGRIIIPIWQSQSLVGWQARHIGELDWQARDIPKYYGRPGMHKSHMLYNIDTAKQWPFVVVVEGVTSVWRIGGPAVALLGKTLSSRQRALLQEHWANKPVVLVLDPDARDEMEGIVRDMQGLHQVQVIPVYLPPGGDPDNYEQSAIVDLIRGRAAQHGVELPVW